jgi:alkanesulfonate monooxygenase SsuD/methylene tetrahydromethanopterin reductase-like flavin-dependent oxidoreductase (luciferase family)
MAEQGFPDEARAIREAWKQGDKEKAVHLVPDVLIETLSIAGTPAECRERVEAYRQSGIGHPVIFPVSEGPMGKQHVLEAVQACAP